MADTPDLLRDVLARLDALEQENRELRARLDARPAAVEPDSPPTLISSSLERMNRRWVLRRGAQAAAAVAAGVMVSQATAPAKADHSANGLNADRVDAHYVEGSSLNGFIGVFGITNSVGNAGVMGVNEGSGFAVKGFGLNAGVQGIASGSMGDGGIGVQGHAAAGMGTGGTGVEGTGLIGVRGESENPAGYGVIGRALGGVGVKGVGFNGVIGESSHPDYAAIEGNHLGTTGVGVIGNGAGLYSAGVLGKNGTGDGVRGEGKNGVRGTSTNGVGVLGEGGSGYEGAFQGTRAQLRLVPTARTGKPTAGTHQKGELYLDNEGTLFICTKSKSGTTPAEWRRVNTTIV